jgi:hypothetical protein
MTQLSSGKVFGELAVLYNCTRTATVIGIHACGTYHYEPSTLRYVTSVCATIAQQRHSQVVRSELII